MGSSAKKYRELIMRTDAAMSGRTGVQMQLGGKGHVIPLVRVRSEMVRIVWEKSYSIVTLFQRRGRNHTKKEWTPFAWAISTNFTQITFTGKKQVQLDLIIFFELQTGRVSAFPGSPLSCHASKDSSPNVRSESC
jgi:hypothetical protein